MYFKVLHASNEVHTELPKIKTTNDRLKFAKENKHGYTLVLSMSTSKDMGLDEILHSTKNKYISKEEKLWTDTYDISASLRSTSIGDIIEKDGKTYMVDGFGFSEINSNTNQKKNSKVLDAMRSWLETQDDEDKTIMVSMCKKPLSANDIIFELENETELGERLESDIISLTVDLLFRGKETI